jgi:hypothetical protein
MSTCRSCKAPIEWAVTDRGNPMPLDPGTHPDGRAAVIGRAAESGAPLVVALRLEQLERARELGVVELRRSHFQTCPQAETWRR